MECHGHPRSGASVPPRSSRHADEDDGDDRQERYCPRTPRAPPHGDSMDNRPCQQESYGYEPWGHGTLHLGTDECMNRPRTDWRSHRSWSTASIDREDRRGGSPHPNSFQDHQAFGAQEIGVGSIPPLKRSELTQPRHVPAPSSPRCGIKGQGQIEPLPPLEERERISNNGFYYWVYPTPRENSPPEENNNGGWGGEQVNHLPEIQELHVSAEPSAKEACNGPWDPICTPQDREIPKATEAASMPNAEASPAPEAKPAVNGSYVAWEGVSYENNELNKEQESLSNEELLSCFGNSKSKRDGRHGRPSGRVPNKPREKRGYPSPAGDNGGWDPQVRADSADPQGTPIQTQSDSGWGDPPTPSFETPEPLHLQDNPAGATTNLSGNGIHPDRLRMLGGPPTPSQHAPSPPLQDRQETVNTGWAARQGRDLPPHQPRGPRGRTSMAPHSQPANPW